MVICNFYLEGRCRYGEKCWNEHPRGRTHNRGGSVNRVWVNPSQRSGENLVQPSSFSHGGGRDWNQGKSASGSSNFGFNTQNRFSSLGTAQTKYRGGGDDENDRHIDAIQKDMEAWQSAGQWIFSCYSLLKASITGFVELSPEELRMEYYTSKASGNLQSYMNSVQQLVNQWRSRVEELRTMNPNTRAAMVAELNNPITQSSSESYSSFGFKSSTVGFGSSSSSGFGSSSVFPVGDFGSSAQSSAIGFSFAPSSIGFGSSATPPGSSQFGSTTLSASTFSFAPPTEAGLSKSSAAGFSFLSGSAGGFSSSFTSGTGTTFNSGGFEGFGGAAGASGTGRDKKGGGEKTFTPLSDLTANELKEFSAKQFTLGQIPLRPPPVELLAI